MDSKRVLKTEISVTTVDDIAYFLIENTAKTVAVCNANTLVRAYRNLEIEQLVDSFDVKTPDGFPVAKSLKILMKNDQKRVDGYNIFHKTINYGLEKNVSHYFFGNNEHVVQSMINKLNNLYPGINIAGFYCPPLTETEKLTDNEYIKDLLKRDPDIVWVSLGFPKQENFIYNIKKIHQVRSNFVGVGAVFEWVAGTKVKAPEWLANFGLEWIFRLVQEPKRLFRRYLIDNFLFIIYFIRQYLGK
jgi:N-acetylglucosaminyldiphosphoundecaprenol N-acetyl-beta-D-mannosaminyltransferase